MATADPSMHRRGYSHVTSESNERPSTAWSNEDDSQLMKFRTQGMNWASIASNFHGKTPNACRKRHERLMEKKASEDSDGIRTEVLARAYLDCREQIWAPLAEKVHQKWQTVESKCMEKGLKNLQTAGRVSSRRATGMRHDSPFYVSNPDLNDEHGYGGELATSPSAAPHLGQHPLPMLQSHHHSSFHDPLLSRANTTRSNSGNPPIIPPSSGPFPLPSSSPYTAAPPSASPYVSNNSFSFSPSSSASYASVGGPSQTLPSFSRAFDNGSHSGPVLPSLNSYLARSSEPITASL